VKEKLPEKLNPLPPKPESKEVKELQHRIKQLEQINVDLKERFVIFSPLLFLGST